MVNSNNDAIVIGAGIVGSAQALLLARAGFHVTLVEAHEAVSAAGGLNVRTVALSCRSRQLLENHGLWPPKFGCAINEVHATERGKFGSVRLTADDLDVEALGYVVSNAELESFFLEQVKAHENIDYICPGTATLISNDMDSVQVEINGKTVSASLLIAADGSQSEFRESLGITVTKKDYAQFATVANLRCQRNHRNVAFERFTEQGPLAMLPLADRQVAMVYSATEEATERLRYLSDADFLIAIQQEFGGKLGRLESVGKRVVFPLQLIVSTTQTVGCSVLIGNAARTIHPVAGQGLNLALRDIFELAARVNPNQPIAASLEEFSSRRLADQQGVIKQTDRLARLFLKKPWVLDVPFSLVSSMGMLVLDNVPALRNRFGAVSAGLRLPVQPQDGKLDR